MKGLIKRLEWTSGGAISSMEITITESDPEESQRMLEGLIADAKNDKFASVRVRSLTGGVGGPPFLVEVERE